MKRQNVSDAVIKRLPRYYRYLDDLHLKGIVRISSSTLGEKMGITASQIRQDLSCFGEFGQQGYGYNVEELRAEIGRILGVNNQHSIIVVGAGNLGRALMENFPFKYNGFRLVAAFDVDPDLVGTQISGTPVYHIDSLAHYLKTEPVSVCVLTVPAGVAEQTARLAAGCGVTGIWNFTNVELPQSDMPGVQIEDVHFADSLLTLSYMISEETL